MIRDAATWATRPPLIPQVAMAPGAAADFGQILAALTIPDLTVRPVRGAVPAGPDARTVADRTRLTTNSETVTPDDLATLFAADAQFILDTATPPVAAPTGQSSVPIFPPGDAADPDTSVLQPAPTGNLQVASSGADPVNLTFAAVMSDLPTSDPETETADIIHPSGPDPRSRRAPELVVTSDSLGHHQTSPDRDGNFALAQSAPTGGGSVDWPDRRGGASLALASSAAAAPNGAQDQGRVSSVGGSNAGIAVAIRARNDFRQVPIKPDSAASLAPGPLVTADPPDIRSATAPDDSAGQVKARSVRASGDAGLMVHAVSSGRKQPSDTFVRSTTQTAAALTRPPDVGIAVVPGNPQLRPGPDHVGLLPVPPPGNAAGHTQPGNTAQSPASADTAHSSQAGSLRSPAAAPVPSPFATEPVVAAQTDTGPRAAKFEPLPTAASLPFTVGKLSGHLPTAPTGLNISGGRITTAVEGPQLGDRVAVPRQAAGAAPIVTPAAAPFLPAAHPATPAPRTEMPMAPTDRPLATIAVSAAPNAKGLDWSHLPARSPTARANLPHADIPEPDRDFAVDHPDPMIVDPVTDRIATQTDSQSIRDGRAAAPDPVRVMQQIATAATGGQTTDIRLDPAELGQVRLQVTSDSGQISVTLLADRADTAEMLRRHAGELAQDLRALGYGTVNLSFGPGPGQGDGHAQDSQGLEMPDSTPPLSHDSGDPPSGPAPRSALDLRL